MKKFIQYLDESAKRELQTENDCFALIQQINNNYHFHNIGKKPFFIPISMEHPSAYSAWQKHHEAIIRPIEDIKKEKKHIEANIESIDDIIKLVEENPYNSQYEYNIDLKILHNIYDELKKINSMIGLQTLKKSIVDQLLYFIQKLHIGNEGDFKHTVLSGPPGTGKTEIAKLLGLLYSKIGILKNNTFQKVTRGDLIAGYLGQTAIKTQKVIEKSLGGVLFIDEAYSLADYSQNDSFSKECIDTICEALSDHKDNLMVIISGYEEELNETFFKMNKGLESRFIWRFKMDSYSAIELKDIFIKKIKENNWSLESDIPNQWFDKKLKTFMHYGRDMEALFTYTKISHGRRIYGKSLEHRKKLSIDDLDKGYEIFMKNKKIKESAVLNMYI
jgi:SpoVK/Ycf46/Vps4 family AAA+-type ATPase